MPQNQKSKHPFRLLAAAAAILLSCATIVLAIDYTWDSSTASGFQPAKGGTWGTNNYWSLSSGNGTSLVAWVGTGGWTATFGGSDGSYAISVANNPYCDSITFKNSGYTLSSGTIYGNSCRVTPVSIFGFTPPYQNNAAYDSAKAWDGNTGTYCDGPDIASVTYTGIDIGAARTIVKIRFYPRTGYSGRMTGAIFQGSNTSTTAGFVDLATISTQPTEGTWTSLYPTDNTAYRYLRFASPNHCCCNVNEIEFYTYSEVSVATGKTATISSVLANLNAYGLVKSGNGTLTLSGTNTFTGDVNINDGILKANNTAALGDAANTIAVNSGGALDVNAINLQAYTSAITIIGQIDANNGALINSGAAQTNAIRQIALGGDASIGNNGHRFDIARNYTGAVRITGNSHTLTKVGADTISFLGQATGVTAFVINAGFLQFEDNASFGTSPITINSGASLIPYTHTAKTLSNAITMSGGTIVQPSDVWGEGIATFSGTFSLTNANTFDADSNIIISNVMSGAGSIIIAATGTYPGTVYLSGVNTYTGGTTLNTGTLVMTNMNSLGLGTSTVTLNGGTLQMPGMTDSNAFNVAGTAALKGTGGGNLYLYGTMSGSGTINASQATNTLSLEKDLSAFSGTINFSGGTMRMRGSAPTTAATTHINLTSTAALNFATVTAGPIQIGSLTSASGTSITASDAALLTYQLGALGNTDTIAGTIVNSGSYAFTLNKVGSATLTLSGANTYTGVTTISAGTLRAATLANGGASCALGSAANAAANLVIDGGTLSYAGAAQSCDRLFTVGANGATIRGSGTGALNLTNTGSIAYSGSTTHSITFAGTNTGANMFAPVIGNDGANAVSVTKSSAGEWVFTGANTYTGGTTLSAGTLLVGNSSGSGTGTGAVTASGGILGGTGTISGAVNVNSGATLAPGSGGPGTLTISNALTMASGAAYAVELNGVTAGSLYDQTAVTGAITLGNATLTITLGYTPAIGDAFTIIDNQGSGSIVNTFNGIAEGGSATASYNGQVASFRVSYLGGSAHDVTLTCTDVTGGGADDYSQWHYTKKVYINTREGGANIAANQAQFPLLVRLTSENFNFGQAQSLGQDVRFSKSNGVHLNYQIERWDQANSLAEIWVLADTVKGYNDAQYLKMFWGKSDAVDSGSGATVFATGNGFRGVWHLKEEQAGTGNSALYKDATVLHNDGNDYVSSTGTTGIIGMGHAFAGATYDSIILPDNTLDFSSGAFTISVWAQSTTTASGAIVSKLTDATHFAFLFRRTSIDPYRETMYAANGTATTQSNATDIPASQWNYLTISVDAGSNITYYVNGAGETPTQTLSPRNNLGHLRIGQAGSAFNCFNGNLDELRISNCTRSADWIKLCYETQRADQTTVTLEENYSEWAYSQNLYLNTKASGANVAGNVVKFPALVRLDNTVFDFTQAQDSGQDIRFVKQDGTRLYHQIEQWDKANQAAAVWVRVDTVYGNDSSHYITMYWGNNNVNSLSNGKAVFDTGNGFQGVWHFNEGTNSTANDASVNAYNGAASGTTPPADTAGMIGRCRKYDGTTSYFACTGTASGKLNFPENGVYSISAWVNTDVLTASHEIVCKADKQYALHISSGTNWEFIEFNTTYGWQAVGYAPALGWTHLVGVRNGANEYLYANGVIVDSTISSQSPGTRTTNTDVCIGRQGDVSQRFWDGKIDEAEMSNKARSADWIKLCYENQKSGQSLIMFTNEDYSQWTYSHKVTLNTSQSGANVAATQVAFPTLLRLTSSNFPFSQAQDDGRDVRFASSLGKHLPYEIERWDRTSQLAEIWVLADTVNGNNGTQYFTMYWGKTGVPSRSDGTAVFATGNGFRGVWHLKEEQAGTGSSALYKDATVLHNDGNDYVSSTGTTGIIGMGHAFAGATYDSIILPDNTLDFSSGAFTISVWAQSTTAASGAIVSKLTDATHFAFLFRRTSTDPYRETMYAANGTATTQNNATDIPASQWNYLTISVDASSNITYYVNGAGETPTQTLSPRNNLGHLRIGQAGSAFNCFNGNLDELRISNCTRSADWIKLCYQNQKGDQTLVDLDDYTQWAYSKKIYINTSGMGLNGNVLKFPLLVRIDTTLVGFNQAQGCGQDLRFSKADGTRLNYQIEKWDTAGDAAVAWALVDTVFQSSAAQYIKMYWGKSDAIDRSNDSAVFDTANGFVGVWHLSPETGATDTLRDATPNRFTLTNASSTPATSGTIALGRTYNGSNQRCYVNDANGLDQTGSLTLSAWINHAGLPAAGGSSMGLLSKATAEYRFTDSTLSGGGNYLYMTVGGTRYTSSSATAFAVGTWYYAAASLDAAHDTLLFYKNGAKLGNTVTSATGAPVAGANNLNVGDDQSSNWFNGNLDEVRLEKVYRNPDWINLCYNTQVAAQTVVTPGDVEAYLPLTFTRYGTVNQPDSLDSCTIATNKWTVKFDRNVGGGVKWLSPDSMGTATNQLDSNLFYLVTNNNRSDTGLGTLILLDSNRVSARLLQRKTIGGQQYSITYSVLGNGKVYVKVSTYAASNLSPANGLEFRIAGNSVSNITNTASSATASSCSYFLHSDAGAGRLDPCLTLFENWTQADAITGTASTKYTGIKSSTWKLPAHRSQAWEFMIDIAHANWNDTTGVGLKVADYRSPDSMSFYAGTPLLQKAWESQLAGHWQFEEGSGDTAFDYSGSGNYGVRPAGATWTWTAGKWGGSINLAGSSDKVQIADNAALNGVTGFSVCAWVKPAYAMTASSVIFKKFSTNGYIFSGGAGGVAQLTLNATAFPGRTNIGAGTWYHIGAVYTKCYSVFDTVKIFINGKPDTILTGANYSFDASATAAYIGGGFNGLLDDMRFYGRSLTDEDMKAIYQLGYAADRGMYLLRADNNNTAHFAMDGATTRHYYPAFAIDNYWSTAQPSASVPYVYVNGVRQTFNKDYYAALNDPQNRLIIGFNTAINADATRIYISGNDTLNSTITTTMPKMVWGSTTINSTDYFWVKNFTGNCLGAATAKQFFIDWKMGITASKGGDIWYMLSSKTTPNTVIDTTHGTVSQGLIPGTDAVNASTWGTFAVTMNGAVQVKSSQSTSPFTWSVPESSSVRVILRLGQRNLSDSARLFTQWTIYPTGQIFRWDSIPWVKSTAISRVVSAFGMDNVTSPTMTTSRKYLRGHVSHASLQDFCVALLSFKNSGGTVALPWPKDTMQNSSDGTRTQIEFYDGTTSPNTIWNAVPVQCNLYQDFQKAVMDSAYRDSVCKGVQNCTGASPATRLIAGANGSTSLTSVGDLNNDGFNEREGAYIYNADNANTAHFTLTANGDTCRFYPAFRITNYTATTVPQYVYVNNLPKVKDFGFNAYVKTATHELVMQLNQTLCANADIYISFDRTLAVTMDQFRATGGDAVVKLLWSTESEENNLGFFLYRRINPGFLDSIGRLADTLAVAAADTEDPGAARLMKTAAIGYGDSAWRQVNDKIIFGATAGVSYGKRNYSLLDRGVYNDVRYEYKLVAVDYNSARETYDKYAIAMPRRVLPQRYELWTNFPNPFRRLTCLKYDVPVRAKIMLNIYDIRGRLVRQLVRPDKQMKPGFYQVLWDCKDDQGRLLASGPYIYRITAQGFAKARVMVMIR